MNYQVITRNNDVIIKELAYINLLIFLIIASCTNANSISCEESSIKYYNNGKLMQCSLDSSAMINDINFKKNDILFFDEFGVLDKCILNNNIKIINSNFHNLDIIEFYPNGKIKMCILNQATVINGIKFQKNETIYFTKDGKIISKF